MKKAYAILVGFTSIFSAGCIEIQGPQLESLPPSDVLSEVRFKSDAIMIAKGDSHQIVYSLISTSSDTIQQADSVELWSTAEKNIVSVSPTGLIRGLDVSSSPISVVLSYRHKHITMADTVRVYVTEEKIDANEIKMVALDSTRVGGTGVFGAPRLRVDLYKSGNLVRKGSLIPIRVEEPAQFSPDPQGGPDGEPVYRILNPNGKLGKFWIRSSLNLYGIEVVDSIEFKGIYRDRSNGLFYTGYDENYSEPIPNLDTVSVVLSQPCALVSFANFSTDTIDVLFSDSLASADGCAPAPSSTYPAFNFYGEFIGGNISRIPNFGTVWRRSNTIGEVRFVVRVSNTGRIVPWGTWKVKHAEPED